MQIQLKHLIQKKSNFFCGGGDGGGDQQNSIVETFFLTNIITVNKTLGLALIGESENYRAKYRYIKNKQKPIKQNAPRILGWYCMYIQFSLHIKDLQFK